MGFAFDSRASVVTGKMEMNWARLIEGIRHFFSGAPVTPAGADAGAAIFARGGIVTLTLDKASSIPRSKGN
jgi:hypothetical protein